MEIDEILWILESEIRASEEAEGVFARWDEMINVKIERAIRSRLGAIKGRVERMGGRNIIWSGERIRL